MKKNKGISLIVLIVTIIVIIILAGAVILSLANNNPINSANEAVFKSNVASYNSELAIAISNKYLQTNSFVPSTFNASVWDGKTEHITGTIKEYIPSITVVDGAKFSIQGGDLVFVGSNESEKTFCTELNIKGSLSLAYLTNISVGMSTLTPSFSKYTLNYTITVENTTSSISLTPTAEDSAARITINGTVITSGTSSQSINLPVGTTPINIVVSGTDGNTNTYSVIVTRPTTPYLSSISFSGIRLPTFNKNTYTYSSINTTLNTTTITPIAEDTNTTIKVNGQEITSSMPSRVISLIMGINTIEIELTNQNGNKLVYTYTLVKTA